MRKILCVLLCFFTIVASISAVAHVSAAPTIVNTSSSASTDGYISRWGRPYPPQDPNNHTDVSTSGSLLVGQWREKDTTGPGYEYGIMRGYLSFDTSSIPDYAYIMSVKLKLKTASDFSLTDFVMEIWGGQYGVHEIYGGSLGAEDWGCGQEKKGEWNTTDCPGAGAYFEMSLNDDHVNKTGVTQFELRSSREGTSPTGNEYMSFYSGDSSGSEPKLEITYCEGDVPPGGIDEKFVKKTYTSLRAELYHDGDEHYDDHDNYAVYVTVQNVWYIEGHGSAFFPLDLQLFLEMPDWCTEKTHEPFAGDYGSSPISYSVGVGAYGVSTGFSITPPRYIVEYGRGVSNGKLNVHWNAKAFYNFLGLYDVCCGGELFRDTITFFFEFEVDEGYKPTVAVNLLTGIYCDWVVVKHKFYTEDSGWLVVDPPDPSPITIDPAPSLQSPEILEYPCNITSFDTYYNNAQQNLTSLVRGYNYNVTVQHSWLVDRSENTTLTVRLYDAAGNKVASAAKQYEPMNNGNYTDTLTLNVNSSATTGLGELKITMSNKDPEAPDSFNFTSPVLQNVTITNNPQCAMKTKVNGFFYMPNLTLSAMKIDLLFDNSSIEGDQKGGVSPYPNIVEWPDGKVDVKDYYFVNQHWGQTEGQTGWNYLADIVPDKVIDVKDIYRIQSNWGKSGTYSSDLSGVSVHFDTNQTITPDAYGYLTIPSGASSFTVYKDQNPIGALVTFY